MPALRSAPGEPGTRDGSPFGGPLSAALDTCRATLRDAKAVHDLYLLLIQRREEAKQSEISKNPRGQILEPGFRVTFPEVSVSAVPG